MPKKNKKKVITKVGMFVKTDNVNIDLLQQAYKSAVDVLIPLITTLRTQFDSKFTHTKMINEFNKLKNDWSKSSNSTGHAAWKNQITGVSIGFSAHKKDSTLNAQEKKDYILHLQRHLNILNNIIFDYSTENWKKQPSYEQSLENYHKWLINGKNYDKINADLKESMQKIRIK